jgi:hypothetical protein
LLSSRPALSDWWGAMPHIFCYDDVELKDA